jgi:signal transduction histidine kinase/DNA-binding response OmpR family regulator
VLGRLKLGSQFIFLLTLVFLAGILLSGVTLWNTLQHAAEEEITTRASILMETIDSARNYTNHHVNPLLKNKLDTESTFLPEAIPAFAAREIFERFRDLPDYHGFFYKEAAPNPSNIRDKADRFETALVEQFRRQPDLSELSGYRKTAGSTLFYIARPLAVKEATCLQCHGKPADAPKGQIAIYGDRTGFGWKLDEVVATQTIYVPADEVFAHGRRNMASMMSIFTAVFAVAVLSINRLLKQRVIQPLRRLTAIAHQVSTSPITAAQVGAYDAPEIVKVAQRGDEPGQLARTFQDMAHEVSTRELNLSQAVEERTAQLADSIKEAEKAQAKAESADRAKSQFLANMSHELRTPLNAILGFTQLMLRSPSDAAGVSNLPPQTQQRYLDTINRSGEHLLALINNVLEMSKIEAGRSAFQATDFDLFALLDTLQQMLRLKAESKGLQLKFERSSDVPQFVRTDETKLRQVLINLLGNAIKFTQAGSVALRVERGEECTLHFTVTDRGPGIASSERDRLFDPFFQTATGVHSQEGTGLGLSISRKFVQLMGGEIAVESTVGQGSIFRFEIQVELIAHRAIASPKQARSIVGLAAGQIAYRILVVDDKLENRQLLVELLIPIGFEVQTANNGQEAIGLWQSWQPHLIWMDIRMPVMDGYVATQQIKASSLPSPIIIALTGSAFEEELQVALEAGFDDFVRKPFRTETIFAKMAEYLGVCYVYAGGNDAENRSNDSLSSRSIAKQIPESIAPSELTPSDMMVMLTLWIEQLHQAAIKLNSKQIRELIEQIPQQHSPLKNALNQLVGRLCYEDIIALSCVSI